MPVTATPDRAKAEEDQKNSSKARIGAQVMRVLGHPANLRAVVVCPLWGNHYRVNVFLGDDCLTAQIANSYFLMADSDGNISRSSPEIKKEY